VQKVRDILEEEEILMEGEAQEEKVKEISYYNLQLAHMWIRR